MKKFLLFAVVSVLLAVNVSAQEEWVRGIFLPDPRPESFFGVVASYRIMVGIYDDMEYMEREYAEGIRRVREIVGGYGSSGGLSDRSLKIFDNYLRRMVFYANNINKIKNVKNIEFLDNLYSLKDLDDINYLNEDIFDFLEGYGIIRQCGINDVYYLSKRAVERVCPVILGLPFDYYEIAKVFSDKAVEIKGLIGIMEGGIGEDRTEIIKAKSGVLTVDYEVEELYNKSVRAAERVKNIKYLLDCQGMIFQDAKKKSSD